MIAHDRGCLGKRGAGLEQIAIETLVLHQISKLGSICRRSRIASEA